MSDMQSQTPPIEPDLPLDPPSWPKVVGIISICWGALALCCGGFGLASPLMMNMMPPEQRSQFPPSMISAGQMGLLGVGLLLDIFLIVAGALLISRKAIARPLHLVYAVLAILIAIGAVVLNMQQQAVLQQWATDNPDTQFAKQMKIQGNIGNVIGMAVGLVIGLGHPLFCLIWFGLVKRTAASMGPVSSEEFI